MKEIFKQVLHGKSHIQIGKFGITNNLIQQVNNTLKKKKIVKIKFLKVENKLEIKELAKELAEKTNSIILDTRGKTVIIQSKKTRMRE